MMSHSQDKIITKKGILEEYRKKGLAYSVGFGSNPALLVIDMQYGFTNPESPLGSNLENVKKNISKLLELFRKINYPVYFTRIIYNNPEEASIWLKKLPPFRILIKDSIWVKIDDEIRPMPGEKIIDKRFASAFFGTELDKELKYKGVDTLIVTGCTTSGCIRATVVDALQLGYKVIVPIEAVGDRNEEVHYSNLIDIQGKYGDVVTIDEVFKYLEIILKESLH